MIAEYFMNCGLAPTTFTIFFVIDSLSVKRTWYESKYFSCCGLPDGMTQKHEFAVNHWLVSIRKGRIFLSFRQSLSRNPFVLSVDSRSKCLSLRVVSRDRGNDIIGCLRMDATYLEGEQSYDLQETQLRIWRRHALFSNFKIFAAPHAGFVAVVGLVATPQKVRNNSDFG